MKNQLGCTFGPPAGVAVSLLAWQLCQSPLHANPVGPTVSQGTATFSTASGTLTINTSASTYINWQSFNINAGETTTFKEPTATSVVWNQINDPNPSQILGTLNANGYIILQNPAGFYVGGSASINTGGLLLTTAAATTPNLASGDAWSFNAPPPLAKIINYGQINIAGGGSAFLIANEIDNNGTISAPAGNIGLYAGQQVLVSTSPDGRSLSAQVTLPQGSVDNEGHLVADGGTIAAQVQTVNQNGLVQANTAQNVNGVIELVASDSLTLGANSDIEAHGDNSAANTSASAGGSVTLQSGNNLADQAGSIINVSGSTLGGAGGQIGLAASQIAALNSSFNGSASAGSAAGTLSVATTSILLNSDGSPAPGVLAINPNSLPAGFSQINLQAANNLEISTVWTLVGAAAAASVNLTAGNNLTVDNGAGINAGNNWSLSLSAGNTIYLNGASSLQTQNGNIALLAPALATLNGAGTRVSALSGNLEIGGSWTLADAAAAVSLNLTAGNTLTLDDNVGIAAGRNWNVNLTAGSTINFSGSTALQTQNGNLALVAPAIETQNGSDSSLTSVSGNIELGSTWTLADASATAGLSLDAGNNLTLDNGAGIAAGNSWNLSLTAGKTLGLEGNNSLQTLSGNLALVAPVMTTPNGGAVSLNAGSGNLELDSLWSLADAGTLSTLSLIAGNNVTLDGGAEIIAGNNWNIGLTAGNTITLSQNSEISGNGGQITLNAATVNQDGLLQANSVKAANGVIEIDASQAINLGANSTLSAQGDAASASPSPGGFVVLQSGNTFGDTAGSVINVAGASGGQNGLIEIFGTGTTAGTLQSSLGSYYALLINPFDLTLSANPTDTSSSNPNLNLADLANYSQIDVHALDDIELNTVPLPNSSLSLASGNTITLDAGAAITAANGVSLTAATAINFNGSAAIQTAAGDLSLVAPAAQSPNGGELDLTATAGNIKLGSLLTLADVYTPTSVNLTAGNSIILADGAGIMAGNDWNVNLTAGTALPAGSAPAAGQDGIYLDCNILNSGAGGAFIQAQNGDITLWAANEVQVALGGNDQSTCDATGYSGITTLNGGNNGGNINVTTIYGDVNTGQNPLGYVYSATAPYYSVTSGYQNFLGGISTANGGNLTINAGGNVTSYLPYSGNAYTGAEGGSGAFGSNPGNVSITAKGSVYGHYVVTDGSGSISAGQNVGDVNGSGVALSLTSGNWTVNANGNIVLQEVRNPNGAFNDQGSLNAPGRFFFFYNNTAAVDLTAGNGVYLTGENLPRLPGDNVPVLYPASLSITAGAGGVTLDNDVTLFNSPYQNLDITTTAGGNFTAPENLNSTVYLLMSASSKSSWQSGNASIFTPSDNGTGTPEELNNPNPVSINIDGSMDYLNLYTTKATTITVGGSMYDCGFSGENLHAGDTTTIKVTGQIYNQSAYSIVTLPAGIPNLPAADQPAGLTAAWDSIFSAGLDPTSPNLATISPSLLPTLQTTLNSSVVLGLTLPADIASTPAKWANYVLGEANLFSISQAANNTLVGTDQNLLYNPANGLLGASGPLPASLVTTLTQPITVLRLNANGLPITYTTGGVTYFATDQVNWVPASETALVTALYDASLQTVSKAVNQIGFSIGGPGAFDVNAQSISLGNSDGIISCGVDPVYPGIAGANRYVNLGPETLVPASVNVTVTGDLDMFTSTIATVGGGDVTVKSTGGSLDLGSGSLVPDAGYLGYGIFTAGPGDVNVTAFSDINIDSSRIATYDGGNIFIEALQGDVNVGTGGDTPVHVYTTFVNPATGKGISYGEYVYGSGIVANTLLPPDAGVKFPANAAKLPGNITVETPQGNITASLGGITQEALDGNIGGGPTITLTAGTFPTGKVGQPGYFAGYPGNIDLGESGVIGGTVNVSANGNVTGLVISRQASTINAAQNFSGTVLSGGAADVSGGGTVSGTIVGVGGASVSGATVTAAVLGQNVSVNGGASQSTLGSSASATSTSQAAANQSDSQSKQQLAADDGDSDDKKKKKLLPTIQRVKRVTIILPGKTTASRQPNDGAL